MKLLQELHDKADQIRAMGVEARDEARALAVPSYYVDGSIGRGIVEELPDGTKNLVPLKHPESRKNVLDAGLALIVSKALQAPFSDL